MAAVKQLLAVSRPLSMTTDLVCGAEVADDNSNRFFSDYGGEMYRFCSSECKRKFDDHPDEFIRAEARTQLGL